MVSNNGLFMNIFCGFKKQNKIKKINDERNDDGGGERNCVYEHECDEMETRKDVDLVVKWISSVYRQ